MAPVDRAFPVLRYGSRMDNWAAVGNDEFKTVQDLLSYDESVTKLAQSLVADLSDPREKVLRFCEHLRDNVVYQGIEFGTRGVKPKLAQQTLLDKYGDCKDMSVLLYALCAAVAIPAEPVLVNSSSLIIDSIPSDGQFNHMIVHIPGLGFIDPTVKQFFNPDLSPVGLANNKALVLRQEKSELVDLPAYTKSSVVSCQRVCAVEGEVLVVKETTTLTEFYAYFLRSVLHGKSETELREWFLLNISDSYRGAELVAIQVDGVDAIDGDLTLLTHYRLPSALVKSENELLITLPAYWEELYGTFRAMEKRHGDFEIYYPLIMRSDVRLSLPAGYACVGQARQVSGDAHDAVSWSGHTVFTEEVQLVKELTLHAGVYPKVGYQGLVKSCNAAMDFISPTLRLKLND